MLETDAEHRVTKEGERARRRANWVDFLVPIPFFCLPYVVSGAAPRAALAAGCLITWFMIMRPSWRGLQGFYASSLLLLHFLTWTTIAVIARFLD